MRNSRRNTLSMETMEGRNMLTAGLAGNISGLAITAETSKVNFEDFSPGQTVVNSAFASSSMGIRTVDPTVNYSLAWELYGD